MRALKDPKIDEQKQTLRFKFGNRDAQNKQLDFFLPTFRLEKMCGLFIRKCYSELFGLVFDEKSSFHAILTGPQGMGKRFFGFYAMYRLMLADRSFIYEPQPDDQLVWVYHGKNTRNQQNESSNQNFQLECVNKNSLVNYRDRENYVHIINGHTSSEVFRFRVVLICSPYDFHFKNIKKSMKGYQMYYMPAWDENEIKLCRNEFYASLPESLVGNLFGLLGGVPRKVLTQPSAVYGISIYFKKKGVFQKKTSKFF